MAYELSLHDLGEGLTEAEVLTWLVAVGDLVTVGQAIVEVETAKTTVEITTPRDGVLLHQGAAAGTTLEVGRLLAVIGAPGESWEGDEPLAASGPAPAIPQLAAGAPSPAPVKAMPVVRKRAAELGVDLTTITGTGPGGAITRIDVEQAAAAPASKQGETLSTTRRAIAAHLTRSWTEIPHVTVWGPADGTALLAARERGGGGPLEAWLAAAVIPVLAAFPDCNATFDGSTLRRSADVHLGLAVDTPAGLVVPVVKSADQRSTADLMAEIERLVAAAADRSLTPAEVSGATFTLSNVGAVGGGYGTPIIPYGTTTILSVGRARDGVVVVDGAVRVAPLIPLAVSFDHRVIDGASGSRFLAAVTAGIESPSSGVDSGAEAAPTSD